MVIPWRLDGPDMSLDGDSGIGAWLVRQAVLLSVAMVPSALVVKSLWLYTLRDLFGPLAVLDWVGLSGLLSVVVVFFVSADAL